MSFVSQNYTQSSFAPSNTSNLKVIARIRAPKGMEEQKDRKRNTSTSPSPLSSNRNYTSIRVRNRSTSKDITSPSRPYQSARNSSRESSRSRSAQGRTSKAPGLQEDKKYCIFTTKDRSNLVVASEQPVPGKVVNEQLQDVQDLKYFKYDTPINLPSQTFLSSSSFSFTLDSVFNESHKQEKFYVSAVRPLVKSFVEGESGCLILFGPSESGKTYTLKGRTGAERGVLPRAVEDIFNIVKNSEEQEEDLEVLKQEVLSNYSSQYGSSVPERMFLKISVYQIFVDKVIDLLQGGGSAQTSKFSNRVQVDHYIDKESEEVVSRLKNISEKVVFTLEDFYSVLQEAFKNRRIESVSIQEQDLRKKSHFIVSLTLMRRSSSRKLQEVSHLNFVELSGSEQAVAEEKFYMDSSVKQFVTKSFNSLSAQLLRSALKKKSNQPMEEGDSKVVSCLRNTLTSTSSIMLVCCLNPSESHFEHAFPALKFCTRIRDCVIKKLEQRKGSQLGMTSTTVDLVDYSARTSQGAEIENARDQLSKVKDALIDRQLKLNRGQLQRSDMEQWARDQIRQLDRMTQRLRSENLNGSRERANYVVLDELQQLKEHLNKVAQGNNPGIGTAGKNFSQGSFGISSQVSDYPGSNQRPSRNDPRLYQQVPPPEPYNPFSSGGKGFQPYSSQATPTSAFEYPAPELQAPYSHRSNLQEQPPLNYGSLERREPPYSGQKGGQWRDPTSFDTIQTPNFDLHQQQQRGGDPTRRLNEGRREQRSRHNYQGGFEQPTGEPIILETMLDTGFPSSISKARTSHYNRTEQEQILVYPHEESKMHDSPSHKNEAGYRTQKSGGRKLQGGNNQANSSQYAENEFLNKANPMLEMSLTGERNNISAVMQDNGSTKVSVEAQKHAGYRGRNKNESLKQGGQSSHSLFGNQSKISATQQLAPQKSGIYKSERSMVQDHSKQKSQMKDDSVYKTEEEAMGDIARLIKQNDFEVVKKRVQQIYKEKAQQEELLEEMDKNAQGIAEDLEQREQLVAEYQQALQEVRAELEEKLQEVSAQKEDQVREFGEKAGALAQQVNELSAQLQKSGQEKERLKREREEAEAARGALEKEKGEVEEMYLQEKQECDKFRANYEVLKEHELNIIKDFEGKKAKEVQFYEKALADQTQQMKELQEKDRGLEEQVLSLREEIRKLQFDNDKSTKANEDLSTRVSTFTQKLDASSTQNDQLVQDLKEAQGQIHQKEVQLSQAEEERNKAFAEISKLHQLVEEMEKTIQDEQAKRKEALRGKEAAEWQIQQVEREKEEAVEAGKRREREAEEREEKLKEQLEEMAAREEELHQQLGHLGKVNEEVERNLTMIKAKEYDKVDVLKQSATMEARVKYLQADCDNLVRERNTLDLSNVQLQQQVQEQSQQIQELNSELEYFRSTHEELLDKFDDKIESINKEMGKLKNENMTLKEKEKVQRRQVNALEEEKEEWRIKFLEADRRGEEFNSKLFQMEREVRCLVEERERELKDQANKQHQDNRVREENKKQLLDDIQNLIKEKRKMQQKSMTYSQNQSEINQSNLN